MRWTRLCVASPFALGRHAERAADTTEDLAHGLVAVRLQAMAAVPVRDGGGAAGDGRGGESALGQADRLTAEDAPAGRRGEGRPGGPQGWGLTAAVGAECAASACFSPRSRRAGRHRVIAPVRGTFPVRTGWAVDVCGKELRRRLDAWWEARRAFERLGHISRATIASVCAGLALLHGLGRRRELVPASSAILIVLDCLAAGGAESDGRGPIPRRRPGRAAVGEGRAAMAPCA